MDALGLVTSAYGQGCWLQEMMPTLPSVSKVIYSRSAVSNPCKSLLQSYSEEPRETFASDEDDDESESSETTGVLRAVPMLPEFCKEDYAESTVQQGILT